MITEYDGHTLRLASKTTVRHIAKTGQNVEAYIVLEIESPFGDGIAASLSPDDAIKLATTLLRDVNLLRYGSG
jgi:hypothetical protein